MYNVKVLSNCVSKENKLRYRNRYNLYHTMVFPVVMYGCESWTVKKAERWRIGALNCGVGEDSWESLGLPGDPTSPS